jgi:hypothetical protein
MYRVHNKKTVCLLVPTVGQTHFWRLIDYFLTLFWLLENILGDIYLPNATLSPTLRSGSSTIFNIIMGWKRTETEAETRRGTIYED